MNSSPYSDHPWGPVRDALGTTFGRIAVLVIAVLLGVSVGAAIAYESVFGLVSGLLESPWILFSSLFFGVGVIVFPLSLFFWILLYPV